ncbi:armadillo repeat-containing protein 1-like isoform X2 [Eleginops maclovinus]|uniref:armadillo repeat-containing protein 1-like isoform X2 n=1 Tax=Eleginops maclovinus TaxID=56733 RepID=UPI0030807456
MTAEPDPLLVVNQLRDLAADPMNRRAIVQDQGCLPGLILFLDNPNPQVVYSALLAVRYLAECRSNQERLQGELGMMLSLQSVVQKSTTPGETRLLAAEIYELLAAAGSASEPDGPISGRRRAQFFLGSSNKRAKTITLHIEGMDDWSRRNQCEEALLRVRGVISFTFQMSLRRCIVRIRSDLRAEVLVPLAEEGSAAEQNVELPDYLSEDESPSVDPDQAVTRVGSDRDGNSWLGAATNFMSRSFYW